MDARDQLLKAALEVFAESGSHGSTTRRIAQVAGVNEVTLFRHFGSKESLIREALGWGASRALAAHLPETPTDPASELTGFCQQYHQALTKARSIVRKCMGEFEEHPEISALACQASVRVTHELEAYLERVRAAGLASGGWDASAAAAMLMGALFADAMGRDCMPGRCRHSEEDAVLHYASLLLHAIGAQRQPLSTIDH